MEPIAKVNTVILIVTFMFEIILEKERFERCTLMKGN